LVDLRPGSAFLQALNGDWTSEQVDNGRRYSVVAQIEDPNSVPFRSGLSYQSAQNFANTVRNASYSLSEMGIEMLQNPGYGDGMGGPSVFLITGLIGMGSLGLALPSEFAHFAVGDWYGNGVVPVWSQEMPGNRIRYDLIGLNHVQETSAPSFADLVDLTSRALAEGREP
jgi:hypothetical protein